MDLQLLHSSFLQFWPVLGDSAIKCAILTLAVSVAALLMPKAPSARRHLLWVLALTATLAIPLVSALVPSWHLDFGAVKTVMTDRSKPLDLKSLPPDITPIHTPQTVAFGPGPTVSTNVSISAMPKTETHRSSWHLRDLRGFAIEIWLAGVIAMLVPIVMGAISLWRLGRRSLPVSEHSWQNLLESICQEMGISRSVTLLRSDDRAMPMTWGIVHPILLIPSSSDAWSMQQRRMVLMHELAHIRRQDCLSQLLAQLARAVYWFNPLCWWAARQLTVERELACDDWVLRRGALASDYAEQLLAVAAGSPRSWGFHVAAVAMARPSKLGERVMAILDPHRSRASVSRKEAGVVIALLALFVIPMSIVKPFHANAAGIIGLPGGAAMMSADMPPLSADTLLLVKIDLKAVTSESLAETAQSVLGVHADMLNPVVAWYQPLLKMMKEHGATTVWLSTNIEPDQVGSMQLVTFVQLPAGAESKTLQDELTKQLSDPSKEQFFVRQGPFLVIREKYVQPAKVAPAKSYGFDPKAAAEKFKLPIVADAQVTESFVRAMSVSDMNHGVVVLAVPSASMIKLMEGSLNTQASPEKQVYEAFRNTESITVATDSGKSPSLSVKFKCADEARSRIVADYVDEGIKRIVDHLPAIQKNLEDRASPERTIQAKNIGAFADRLRQTKAVMQGNIVELSFDTQALTTIGKGMVPVLMNARQNASASASMSHMKQLLLGIIMYAEANKGLPDKLDDVKDAVGGDTVFKQLMNNPQTNDPQGYVYEKPKDKWPDIKNPSSTVILFELKDGKKNESGFFGYADGHVQRVVK